MHGTVNVVFRVTNEGVLETFRAEMVVSAVFVAVDVGAGFNRL
jgi:hypothetical protein